MMRVMEGGATLQWCRRFAATESIPLWFLPHHTGMLQWCRRFAATESDGAAGDHGAHGRASMVPPLRSDGEWKRVLQIGKEI